MLMVIANKTTFTKYGICNLITQLGKIVKVAQL